MTIQADDPATRRPALSRPELIGASILLAALAAALLMAEEIRTGARFRFDTAILLGLRGPDGAPIGPSWAVQAFSGVTALAGFKARWLFGGAAIAALALLRRRIEAAWLAAALCGAMLLDPLLKALLHRPRPTIISHLTEASGSSFPSGHALVAAAAYLTLGAMIARHAQSRAGKAAVMAAAVLLVGLIGISRVYLGVHWPSDVIAGWTFGGAWALAVMMAKERLAGR
jgi:undecaprenyl-diphosphatase